MPWFDDLWKVWRCPIERYDIRVVNPSIEIIRLDLGVSMVVVVAVSVIVPAMVVLFSAVTHGREKSLGGNKADVHRLTRFVNVASHILPDF